VASVSGSPFDGIGANFSGFISFFSLLGAW
jgi:hypothetical protein